MSIQDPKIWGKYYWYTMKSIACTANLEDSTIKLKVIQFLDSLQLLLPCEECAEHYKNYLEVFPINQYTKSNEQLIKWVNSLEDTIKEVVAPKSRNRATVTSDFETKSLNQMKAEARAFKESRIHKNNLETLMKSLDKKDPNCCGN